MISVIIPVYNRDDCLPRCLDSVLQQTFSNWECILIDDGSTDRSLSVCHRYLEKDSRFKVYSQQNSGVSAARNKGVELACGEYIVFIDSDDWVEPELLRLLYESTEKGTIPLCGMDIQCIDGDSINCSVQDILYRMNSNAIDLLTGNLFGLFAGPVCKLYDRNIIESYCIRFPLGISWGEDLIFNCNYFQHIDCIKGIPFLLYHVISQKESLTTNAKYDLFLTDVSQILWQSVSGFFLNKGLSDNTLLNDYYICQIFAQIKGVRYVRDRLSWIKRYRRMNYLVQSADRKILKKYRFKSIWILLTYYRLSTLVLVGYELYCFLIEYAKEGRNHQ